MVTPDSYVLGCFERVLATRRVHPPKGRSRRPMLASTLRNRHGSARLDAQKDMPARQPLEMPGCYRFHSTRRAPWKRVSVASSVDRHELQAHDATVLQCLAVGVGKAWEDRPGCAIRHLLPSSAPHKIWDSCRALRQGAAFDLPCRCCQATRSITSSLPLNEIASPARLPSNSA